MQQSTRARQLETVAAIAASAVTCTAGLFATTSAVVARTVVTPPRRRVEDIRVEQYWETDDGAYLKISGTSDARIGGNPGLFSFWFDDDYGHAVLGPIVDQSWDTVTRRVLRVDAGDLTRAFRGRINGWVWISPDQLGLPWESVELVGRYGPLPAWVFPAADPESTTWAIHVHGRGSKRAEVLRGVPVMHREDIHSIVVSYSNDGEGPNSPDGKYGLGDTEWLDLDVAMQYALDHGAKRIILVGWSMGGSIALQSASRSRLRDAVVGMILDSPAVDWIESLRYQADAVGLPRVIQSLTVRMLAAPWGRSITGLQQSINVDRLNWVARAHELTTPTLLMHSDDDGYVPSTPSRELAASNPQAVTYVPFQRARHCKLWNVDRPRWESSVSTWLRGLPR